MMVKPRCWTASGDPSGEPGGTAKTMPLTAAGSASFSITSMETRAPSDVPASTRALPGVLRQPPAPSLSGTGTTSRLVSVASGSTVPRSTVPPRSTSTFPAASVLVPAASTLVRGSQVTIRWMTAPKALRAGLQTWPRGATTSRSAATSALVPAAGIVDRAGRDERRPRLGRHHERRHHRRRREHLVGDGVDEPEIVPSGVGDRDQRPPGARLIDGVPVVGGDALGPAHLGGRARGALGAAGQGGQRGEEPGSESDHWGLLPMRRGLEVAEEVSRSRSAAVGSASGTRSTLTVQSRNDAR